MPADIDAIGAIFPMNADMQNAPPPHFAALLADKARSGGAGDQTIPDHEGSERPG